MRVAKLKWNEHEDKYSRSKLAKHLKKNPTHKLKLAIMSKEPGNFRKCRVLEEHFIKIICLIFNE